MNQSVKMEDPFPPPPSSSSSSSSFFSTYSSFLLQDPPHYDTTTTFLLDFSHTHHGFPNTTSPSPSPSLGFMDLLNTNHFPPPPPPPSFLHTCSNQDHIFNTPLTPNSSSISSQSNDKDHALLLDGEEPQHPRDNDDDHDNDVDEDEEEEERQNNTTKKQLKPTKKAIQKRKREPRFAFMTKSEVDHLEDGYRWRKYGQKAVKNSAFPRSYYRCTSTSCNVKKRVERCWNDPSVVVTTYEGQHTHPSPIMHHRSSWQSPPNPNHEMPIPIPMAMPQGFLFSASQLIQSSSTHHHVLLSGDDHGLLQDVVVPSTLTIKKEHCSK